MSGGSISRMLAQAKPDKDVDTEAKPEPQPEQSGLRLPNVAPPEVRKPMTARVKPSVLKEVDGLKDVIKDAGFHCTREYVLEALFLELRDNKELRERVAERVVSGEIR